MGNSVPALEAMIETLKKTKDQPVQLTVLRDGKTQTFTVQPVLSDVTGLREKRYRVGISSIPMKVTTLPFVQAFNMSLERNKRASVPDFGTRAEDGAEKDFSSDHRRPSTKWSGCWPGGDGKRLDPAARTHGRDQSESWNL